MTIAYVITNTNEADTAHGSINQQLAASAVNDATSADLVSGNYGPNISMSEFSFCTQSGEPNEASWPTGLYECFLDVSAAGGGLTYGLLNINSLGHFGRVNDARDTEVEAHAQDEVAFSGTGLKTATYSGPWGGATASDRFECLVAISRDGVNHGNQAITLTVNNSGSSRMTGAWVTVTPSAHLHIVDESESISSILARSLQLARIDDDAINLTHDQNRIMTLARSIDEVEQLQEDFLSAQNMLLQVDETEQIVESSIAAQSLIREVASTLNIQEAVLQMLGKIQVVDETQNIGVAGGGGEIAHVYAEELTDQTHTGDLTYTTKLTVDGSNFVGSAKYLLIVSSQVGGNNANGRFKFRVQFGGVTPTGAEMILEPGGSATPSRHPYVFGTVWTTPGSPGDVIFQIAPQENTGDTARADTIQLFAIRLDDDLTEGVDWFWDEDTVNTTHATGPGSWDDRASITFTPSNAGDDWLVLAFGEYEINSTALNANYRINQDSDTEVVPMFSQEGEDTEEEFPWFLSRVYNLDDTEHIFTVQSQDDDTGVNNHNRSGSFAINLAKFETSVWDWTEEEIILAVNSTWEEIANLTITPATVGNWIALGNAVLDSSDIGDGGGIRCQLAGSTVPTGKDANRDVITRDATDELYMPLLSYLPNLAASSQDIDIDGLAQDVTLMAIQNRSFAAFSLELSGGAGVEAIYVLGLNRIIDNTLSISEGVERVFALIRVNDNTLQITEQNIKTMTILRIQDETINITEDIVRLLEIPGGLDLVEILNETINIPEGFVRLLDITRIDDDTLQLVESIVLSRNLLRLLSDTVVVLEGSVPAQSKLRTIIEVIELIEELIRFGSLNRIVSDTVQIQETLTKALSLVSTVSDTLNIIATSVANFGEEVFGFLVGAVSVSAVTTANLAVKAATQGFTRIKHVTKGIVSFNTDIDN